MGTILSDEEYSNIHSISNLNTSPVILHLNGAAGDCKLGLYDYDVDIPHLHIRSINKDFEICICLLESKYYSHCGKFNKTLNYDQLKILNNFMNQKTINKNGNYNKRNYWELYIFIYECFCVNCKYKLDCNKEYKQPDYTLMKNYIM